jgi:hypothetical protein
MSYLKSYNNNDEKGAFPKATSLQVGRSRNLRQMDHRLMSCA